MPRVGLESTIPAFERAKTVHSVDRAVTVIGMTHISGIQLFFLCNQMGLFRIGHGPGALTSSILYSKYNDLAINYSDLLYENIKRHKHGIVNV
jgi:hypothetical protein